MDERGVSESVQWAVILPALLLCVLGLVQAGVWLHGRQVVQTAAMAAADAQADLGAPPGAGVTAARRVAAAGGFREVTVTVSTTDRTVQAQVRARVPTILDVGQGQVVAEASAPKERVTR